MPYCQSGWQFSPQSQMTILVIVSRSVLLEWAGERWQDAFPPWPGADVLRSLPSRKTRFLASAPGQGEAH